MVSEMSRSIGWSCWYFVASVWTTCTRSCNPRNSIMSVAIMADEMFVSRQVTFVFADFKAAISPRIGIGPHPASMTSIESLSCSS